MNSGSFGIMDFPNTVASGLISMNDLSSKGMHWYPFSWHRCNVFKDEVLTITSSGWILSWFFIVAFTSSVADNNEEEDSNPPPNLTQNSANWGIPIIKPNLNPKEIEAVPSKETSGLNLSLSPFAL